VIEINDRSPAIEVQPTEYGRLLGYPPGWTLDGRAQELAAWAREWYARHGRPWTYARGVDDVRIDAGAIVAPSSAAFPT